MHAHRPCFASGSRHGPLPRYRATRQTRGGHRGGEARTLPRASDPARARLMLVAPGRRGAGDAPVPGSRRARRDPAAPRPGRGRAARRDPPPGARLAADAVAGRAVLRHQPRRDERLLLRRPRPAPTGHGSDHPVPRPAQPRRRVVPPHARPRLGLAGRDRRCHPRPHRKPPHRDRRVAQPGRRGVRPGLRRVLGHVHRHGSPGERRRARPRRPRRGDDRGYPGRHAVRGTRRLAHHGAAAPDAAGLRHRDHGLGRALLPRAGGHAPGTQARLRHPAQPRARYRNDGRLAPARPAHRTRRTRGGPHRDRREHRLHPRLRKPPIRSQDDGDGSNPAARQMRLAGPWIRPAASKVATACRASHAADARRYGLRRATRLAFFGSRPTRA